MPSCTCKSWLFQSANGLFLRFEQWQTSLCSLHHHFQPKALLPHTLHQIALLNTWYQYIPIEPSRRQTKSDACDQSNSNPVSVTLGFNLDLSLCPTSDHQTLSQQRGRFGLDFVLASFHRDIFITCIFGIAPACWYFLLRLADVCCCRALVAPHCFTPPRDDDTGNPRPVIYSSYTHHPSAWNGRGDVWPGEQPKPDKSMLENRTSASSRAFRARLETRHYASGQCRLHRLASYRLSHPLGLYQSRILPCRT